MSEGSARAVAAALAGVQYARTLERARPREWGSDLRRASDAVLALAAELRRHARAGAPAEATASDLLLPEETARADRSLRALRGEPEARDARWTIARAFPSWRDLFAAACSPGVTVGSVNAPALEKLGDLLRRMSEMVDGWVRLEERSGAGERVGASGRHPDVADRHLVAVGRANGLTFAEMAQALLALGIERPEVGDGGDPVMLVADRLRKKAMRAKRKQAKRRK